MGSQLREGAQVSAALRILQIVQKPQRRGAEIFALQLSEQLRLMGHEVKTAYLYPHEGENPLPLARNDEVLGGREHHCFEKIPGVHPLLLRRLRRVIADWQPDVVQVNGGRTLKYGAAATVGFRTRPWVLIYRSIGQPHRWLRGPLHRGVYARLVIPRVHGIVGLSSTALRALGDVYHLTMPTAGIPCGVDPASLSLSASRALVCRWAETPPEAHVVLYVGALSQEKRVDRLLRIVETATRKVPNLFLWIVGDGPERAALEQQVRTSSLGHCVRFMGVQNEVANYMSAADLVVLTSDTEGMPGVVLEAGLLQRTVVTTRVGGVSECVLNGRTGILIERNDEAAFAEAIIQLLQQPERRQRLGYAAREWVEENFALPRIAEEFDAFYKDVLSPSGLSTS